MRDISFIIPIRVDTPDRLENCETVLRFLTAYFPEAELQLIEQDTVTHTAELRQAFPQVRWHFEKNTGHFWKSSALNTGFVRATRRCVCAYDTDILLEPDALRRAATLICSNQWPIVLPFNLMFVDISGDLRKHVINTLDISQFSRIRNLSAVPKHPLLSARVLSGGIMMCDRDMVIAEGGYNKKMISYGWEDIEFFKRFAKLGYYSFMLKEYNLIHLDHRRGPDSRINEMYAINKAEYEHVLAMSTNELRSYVVTDLCISTNGADKLSRLRRALRIRNVLLLRRLLHTLNRLQIQNQLHGFSNILRRMLLRSAASPITSC